MTSEEMKDEVLSRVEALNKKRTQRIKAATATAVCAAIVCAAAVPIYKSNRNDVIAPSAQTTRPGEETKTTAGNKDGTTVRVTISAPTAKSEPTKGYSHASNVPPYEERTTAPANGITEKETKLNEPSTEKSAAKPDGTTVKNDSDNSKTESTTKNRTSMNYDNLSPTSSAEPSTVTGPVATTKYALPPNTKEPNAEEPTDSTPRPSDSDIIDGAARVQSIDDVLNNIWSYKVENIDCDGENVQMKLPSKAPVIGNVTVGDDVYGFYAETDDSIPNGEYRYLCYADELDALKDLDGYLVYKFSGFDGIFKDALLVTNEERSFIFTQLA